MTEESEKATPTSVTLFPSQRKIVEDFATAERRSMSNAMQVIIEEWARMKALAARPVVITEHYVATHPETEVHA